MSFGPLGPELQGVQSGKERALSAITQKLLAHGYSVAEAEELLRRLVINTVDEDTVTKEVFQILSTTITAGDPQRAFDLIVWWLLQAVEYRRQITARQLRDRLQSVGRYLAEREAHLKEWFTTIKPLTALHGLKGVTYEELEREYYRGAAARYSHILAGLDVRREELLERIEKMYGEGRRVIILHGASGQGKTSLALRYFHEAVPDDWRFLISSIENRRHAVRISQAIADHLRSIDSPLYLLLDVAPRDLEWVTLVRELLDIGNVRILIAIREEDLARRTATDSELGFPADLHLEFSELEAKGVYDQLMKRVEAANPFPTFGEAWARFGGRGPLLEFVYLITQTESLRSRLNGQIRRLREEVQAGRLEPGALYLLHSCAVATAFEARVRISALAELLDLRDPAGLVDLFEDEYLLRASADRRHIEALHPVRSSLLAEALEHPTFARSAEVAMATLPCIPEDDFEVFVLYLLSRIPDSWALLQRTLPSLRIATWIGAAGLGRALLWWGVKSYLGENKQVLDEAEELGGESWRGLVLGDIANAAESDPTEALIGVLGNVNASAAEKVQHLRDRLSPTFAIFEPLRQWLPTLGLQGLPQNTLEWESLAEIMFWVGRLELPPPDFLDVQTVPVDQLPLEVLSKISLALGEVKHELQVEFLNCHRELIRRRLLYETNTLLLEEDSSSVSAHFLVPFELLSGPTDLPGQTTPARGGVASASSQREAQVQAVGAGAEGLESQLNSEAVRRAEFLKAFFPGKEHYCTQGHGHLLSFGGVELPYDGSRKRMPATVLLPALLTWINGVTHSLAIYQRRPATWKVYAQILLGIRETIATVWLKLHRALVSYFEGTVARSLFGGTLTLEQWQAAKKAAGSIPHLPLTAVDEWGLSSETQRLGLHIRSNISSNLASDFALRRHASFSKAVGNYVTAAFNFLNAAETILVVHGITGRSPQGNERVIAMAEAQINYGEDKIRLSKHNLFEAMTALAGMQTAFTDRVGSLVDAKKLRQVEGREARLFPELWALWYQFCHFPGKRVDSAGARARKAFEDELGWLRERLLQALRSAEKGRATILDEGYLWQGYPALVLRLELISIADVEEERAEIVKLLGEALGGQGLGSLRQFALSYYWSRIVIIPTFGGMALEPGGWIIPSFVIPQGESDASPDRSWLRPLQLLAPEELHKLGLELPILSDVSSLTELQQCLGRLQLAYSHIYSFSDLIPRLDGTGKGVLERYLSELAREVGRMWGELSRLLSSMIDAIRQLKILEEAVLEVLLHPLVEAQEQMEMERGGTISLHVSDFAGEAERMQQLLGSVVTLRWLSVPGVVESISEAEEEAPPDQSGEV